MKPLRLSLLLAPWARPGLIVIATLLAIPVACVAPSAEESQHPPSAEQGQKISIAMLLFPGFDPLDVMGPLEMYSRNPDFDVKLVAKTPERVPSSNALIALNPSATLDEIEHPDVLVIPGGRAGVTAATKDPALLGWLKTAHETSRYTTSVCTGALILGSAEILKGKKATTHWEVQALLAGYGASGA